MSALLLTLAFTSAFFATWNSRSMGLGVVLTFGYFYGIVRGNLPDGLTHFLFDSAVVGYYTALVMGCWPKTSESMPQKELRQWFVALTGWTVVMFLIPIQDIRVQLVGLRGNCFLLPFMLVGSRLESREVERLAVWLAALNLIAFGFAIAEFVIGVPQFFPVNEVNKIILNSKDVGNSYRIPATFANAHSFGGTLVTTLPWILAAWTQKRQNFVLRVFFMCAILATIIGVFMSAARTAVLQLAIVILAATLSGKMPPIFQAVWILLLGGAGYIISGEDRLQRFMTLFDSEKVFDRIQGSMNMNLFELLVNYPLGNGMGAGGTSLPYFLAYLVKNPIGLESEYSRILLEQGIPGLLLWIAFIGWIAWRRPREKKDPWLFCRQLIWVSALFSLGDGFLGVGLFTGIPQSALLFLGIGFAVTPTVRKRVATPAKASSQRLLRSSAYGKDPSAALG